MTFVLAARRQIGYALGRAAGGLSWLLRDDFTTDLPAGSVNGTAAEPGPGTRVVVDTANKLWLESGRLRFALRDPHISGDPGLWLSAPIQRIAGRMAIFDIPVNYSNFWVGWDSDLSGPPSHAFYWYDALRIDATSGAVIQPTVIDAYALAIALRNNGAFYFKKQPAISNRWLLSWIGSNSIVSPLYITVSGYYHAPAVSKIGVPNEAWLPTPLASDGFGSTFGTTDGLGHAEGIAGGIGAGGGGVAWSNAGSTWSVSGGKAINTPSLGAELVVNGSMEAGDPPTSWTANNATLDGVADERPGGGGSQSLEVTATSVNARAEQAITLEANQWYNISGWCKRTGGSVIRFSIARASDTIAEVSLDASNSSWAAVSATGFVTVANCKAFCAVLTTGGVGTFDDFSTRKLEPAELLTLSDVSCADVFASVSMVLSTTNTYEKAGLALNWDSAVSPNNGVIVVRSAAFLMVFKCLAGVWSRVSSTAYTYSAGARLVVAKVGTSYRTYYNNALIKADTISDAGIINNTLHGLFSTDASNTLDDYVCYATGTGGEYATLDQYIQ